MDKKNPARKLGRTWPILGGLLLLQLLMGSTCILDAIARQVAEEAATQIHVEQQQTAAAQTPTQLPIQSPTPGQTPTPSPSPSGTPATPTPTGTPTPTPTVTGTPTPTSSPSSQPTIAAFSPTTGGVGGGTTVFITGTNLVNVTDVLFNGTPAMTFEEYSPTQINAISPPSVVGSGPIEVRTLSGHAFSPTQWSYTAGPMLNTVYPLLGSTSGGTVVNIVGNMLGGATQVTFNGSPAVSFVVLDGGSRIEAITGPGSGSGPVIVTTTQGTGRYPYQAWLYTTTTQIQGFAPANGSTAGGTKIKIFGTNFTGMTGPTAVWIGPSVAASYTVDNDGQITAYTSSGNGTGQIKVNGPGGPASSAQEFSYDDNPAIESVNPTDGPPTGGTVVDIFGQGFTGAINVKFNDIPATSFTVLDDAHIQATTAAGAGSGPVEVYTEISYGHSLLRWTYTGAGPILSAFGPHQGVTTGNTTVYLFGSGFTGTTDVMFAGISATSFTVLDDSRMEAQTSPGAAATFGQVKIITPSGWAVSDLEWKYSDAPNFDAIPFMPFFGPLTGGTLVNIQGARFSGAMEVKFNDVPAASYTVDSDNQITAFTAPGSGSGPLTVTNFLGSSHTFDLWTYTSVPVIKGAAPFAGPLSGGTMVTIMGVNFTGATAVKIAGVSAAGFTVLSDDIITAFTGPSGGGAGEIEVTTPNGTARSPFVWTYGP